MLDRLVQWVLRTVEEWGYGGIVVMMTIESSFIPFPSEVAMIPAGVLAAQGKMDPGLAVLSGLSGSILGAWFNYCFALWFGRPAIERLGRWVFVSPESLDKADRFFASHGEITTFVGRLIPMIRQLISVPAGLARMNFARFTFYTSLGAGLWCAVLVAVGYWAGMHEDLWRPMLQKATLWVLGGAAFLVAVYVWRHRRRRATAD